MTFCMDDACEEKAVHTMDEINTCRYQSSTATTNEPLPPSFSPPTPALLTWQTAWFQTKQYRIRIVIE